MRTGSLDSHENMVPRFAIVQSQMYGFAVTRSGWKPQWVGGLSNKRSIQETSCRRVTTPGVPSSCTLRSRRCASSTRPPSAAQPFLDQPSASTPKLPEVREAAGAKETQAAPEDPEADLDCPHRPHHGPPSLQTGITWTTLAPR